MDVSAQGLADDPGGDDDPVRGYGRVTLESDVDPRTRSAEFTLPTGGYNAATHPPRPQGLQQKSVGRRRSDG